MTEQNIHGEKTKEKMELAHEPEPGYRKIFYWTITAGVVYLGFIFIKSC